VLNGDDLDASANDAVVNDVGEAVYAHAADGFVLRGVQLRRLPDTVEDLLDGRQELNAKTFP
jgi:hypothetical protein